MFCFRGHFIIKTTLKKFYVSLIARSFPEYFLNFKHYLLKTQKKIMLLNSYARKLLLPIILSPVDAHFHYHRNVWVYYRNVSVSNDSFPLTFLPWRHTSKKKVPSQKQFSSNYTLDTFLRIYGVNFTRWKSCSICKTMLFFSYSILIFYLIYCEKSQTSLV